MTNTHDHDPVPVADGDASLSAMYDDKPPAYFGGVRADILAALPPSRDAHILEIGCGHGETGARALQTGKCGEYCGIELYAEAAAVAQQHLSQVICGDAHHVPLPWPDGFFDVLILSEVLEHLVDPHTVLKRLRPLLRAGGQVFASSPNVSHHSVVRMAIGGKWTTRDSGIMDRTHVRWFTPSSFRQMFEQAGYQVDHVEPLVEPGWKGRLFNTLTAGAFRHLTMAQMNLRGRAA